MKQYVIKRLLATVPLLLVISFLCFCFINLIPSDPAEVALRMRQTPIITEEAIAEVSKWMTIRQGDLIYIQQAQPPRAVQMDEVITATINGEQKLYCKIK